MTDIQPNTGIIINKDIKHIHKKLKRFLSIIFLKSVDYDFFLYRYLSKVILLFGEEHLFSST